MRKRAEQAWRMRWGGMLACAMSRAIVSSVLGLTHSHAGEGNVPAAFGTVGWFQGEAVCNFD